MDIADSTAEEDRCLGCKWWSATKRRGASKMSMDRHRREDGGARGHAGVRHQQCPNCGARCRRKLACDIGQLRRCELASCVCFVVELDGRAAAGSAAPSSSIEQVMALIAAVAIPAEICSHPGAAHHVQSMRSMDQLAKKNKLMEEERRKNDVVAVRARKIHVMVLT